ncbi:MAG: Cthe_2314 family HEPN domain-containing protein [Patescibacteria group bacterium]
MQKDFLLENGFVKRLNELNSEIIRKSENLPVNRKRRESGEKTIFSPQGSDRYCVDAFMAMVQITSVIDSLDHTRIYICRYPYSKSNKSIGITQSSYMRYFEENYYLRVVSLFDRLCFLVNVIYEIGLPSRSAKFHLLQEISYLKGIKIIKLLKDFEKCMSAYKEQRNSFVHRKDLCHEDLNHLALAELILSSGHKKDMEFKGYAKISLMLYKNKIKIKMKKEIKDMKLFVDLFFKEISTEFEKRLDIKNKD